MPVELCHICDRATAEHCLECDVPLCPLCADFDVDFAGDPPRLYATHYKCPDGCEEKHSDA